VLPEVVRVQRVTERVMTVAETFSDAICAKPEDCCRALSRVWKALKIETYAAAGGLTVDEHVATLAREVETLKAAVESHKAEVEHWVQRYNEIDAWRQQTAVINARLTAENKAGAVAVVDHLTKEVERLTAENQRLKDDCGKPLTEGE
jgi:cell shape-determining protein MreC